MKLPLCTLFLTTFLWHTSAQTTSPGQDPASQPQESQPQDKDRSVLEVRPGDPVIKNKDLWEKTGYVHPFVRMPRYILQDQKAIWTSPTPAKSDIKWWVIFGTATGALIATDKWTVKQLPNTNAQVRLGTYTSNVGAAYTLVPLSAGFYFLGTAAKSERFRETGLLGFEALIDATLVETIIKAATDRARPLEANGKGGFWDSTGTPLNASFPSGHAISSFALASVFAHQYSRTIYVPIIAYALAGTVAGSRMAARRHFPSDVVVGSVMGWFIGDYVYGKRHNPELDPKKATVSQKILAHVHFGLGVE